MENNGDNQTRGWLKVGDFPTILRQLWPEPIEAGNCVVLAHQRDGLKLFLETCNGDESRAERGANHVHLDDLLYGVEDRRVLTPNDWQLILRLYKTLLAAELSRVTKGRSFEIHTTNEDRIPIDPHECEITFNMVRNAR